METLISCMTQVVRVVEKYDKEDKLFQPSQNILDYLDLRINGSHVP